MSIAYPRYIPPAQYPALPIRAVPNPYRSFEEWQEFHGHDLPVMSDDERHRDLLACDRAILSAAPNAHWWYFNRCRQIRSLLSSRKGAA